MVVIYFRLIFLAILLGPSLTQDSSDKSPSVVLLPSRAIAIAPCPPHFSRNGEKLVAEIVKPWISSFKVRPGPLLFCANMKQDLTSAV